MATLLLATREYSFVGEWIASCLSLCALLSGKQQTPLGIFQVLCSLIPRNLKSRWEMYLLYSLLLSSPSQQPS